MPHGLIWGVSLYECALTLQASEQITRDPRRTSVTFVHTCIIFLDRSHPFAGHPDLIKNFTPEMLQRNELAPVYEGSDDAKQVVFVPRDRMRSTKFQFDHNLLLEKFLRLHADELGIS